MEPSHSHKVEHGFPTLAFIATILAGFAFAVGIFKDYGSVIFALTPIAAGCVSSLVFARVNPGADFPKPLLSILYGCLTCTIPLVLGGIEGVICVVMAAPVGMLLGLAGWLIAVLLLAIFGKRGRILAAPIFLLVPAASFMENKIGVRAFDDRVETIVRIDAPPAKIWPLLHHLELPEPNEPLFRAGVAHPLRVETNGLNRTCVLSTGRMAEKIEGLEPEKRLRFRVLNTPPSMKELSPYSLHPAHLDDYYQCETGEFELRPQADGSTLLIGKSTYRCRYAPEIYWKLWTRRIVRDVHLRVMREIEAQAERS